MQSNQTLPKVLLVGRMNVGKSTLFNRLAEKTHSIVFEHEGVTRDYLQEKVEWEKKSFWLIDAGGLSFKKLPGEIDQRVQENVRTLLTQATLILFVVDGKNGLVDEDHKIAQTIRKAQKPTILLVNKADNTTALEENLPEFYALGIEPVIPVSGIHNIGMSALLDAVIEKLPALPKTEEEQKPHYKVAIIGRPNAGKSSLMNLLIQHERSIVSSVAGTTREAISEMAYCCNDLIQITDTAGVRRSRKVDDDLEQLMVKNSLQAVKDANIILIMIDASEGKIADQELKLLFYAYEHKKMVIALFNKTDLLDEYKRLMLDQDIDKYAFLFKKIPSLWISCLTQKNIGKIFVEIQNVWRRCSQIFNEIDVDETIKKDLEKIHLYHTELQLKVLRVNTLVASVPSFILHVNYPEFFGPSELGCIENILRKHYDLAGCPIRFIVKEAP